MKTLSIIGLVICVLGIIGSIALIVDDPMTGILGFLVYSYFLAFSIVVLVKGTKSKEQSREPIQNKSS
ncbi:MAG: hypothetical protein NT039_02105 [Candidatus Berkelbacteria bacterium]|nr:hypothetical protein [Candidatus Berkelbacteria bacterium]